MPYCEKKDEDAQFGTLNKMPIELTFNITRIPSNTLYMINQRCWKLNPIKAPSSFKYRQNFKRATELMASEIIARMPRADKSK